MGEQISYGALFNEQDMKLQRNYFYAILPKKAFLQKHF